MARLSAARIARDSQQSEQAERLARAAMSDAPTDEGPRSLMLSMGLVASAPSAPAAASEPATEPAGDAGAPAHVGSPESADAGPSQLASEPATTPNAPEMSGEYLTHVQAGRRALELRLLPRARAEFRRALEVRADGVEAQIGLAWVALRIGYYPVAVRSFRRLYSQGHTIPEVRAGLGLTHAKLRDREEAVRYLRSYLASGPHGPLAQEARRALVELGAG
jgi:tetratricopeptide (TPR) repeat protein